MMHINCILPNYYNDKWLIPNVANLYRKRSGRHQLTFSVIDQRETGVSESESLLTRWLTVKTTHWIPPSVPWFYPQLEDPEQSAINDLLGHSVTCRIALGPQAGRKAFTLQSVPGQEQDHDHPNLAKTAGFSLHAGLTAKAHQRRKLERLCCYIARPAVATDRLALTFHGNVRYDVKGFTNVAGAGMRRSDHPENAVSRRHHAHRSLDFIARLAALVPKPRVNLVSTGCSHRTARCDTTSRHLKLISSGFT